MAAAAAAMASTSTAVREGEDDYMEEEEEEKRDPKQQSSAPARLDPDLWSTLSDNLTEKIIARLPFKALFRAAALSRTWSLAFRSPAFQNEVLRSSSPWASYSPLFVNEEQQLVGFDGGSQLWHRLPTHLRGWEASGRSWRLMSSGGSLLCWTDGDLGPSLSGSPARDHIRVSNPLNGSWRQLPPPPEYGCCAPLFHVVCERGAYQVILFSLTNLLETGKIYMRVFDSSSESWIITSHGHEGQDMDWGDNVLLNGVSFVLSDRRCIGCNLVSFHVKDRIWNVVLEDADRRLVIVPNVLEFRDVFFSQLVVCGSYMMLVAHYEDGLGSDADEGFNEDFAVFEVDLELGVAFRLSIAPVEMLTVGTLHGAVGYGDCVYIFGSNRSSLTVSYNVKTFEWNLAALVPDTLSTAVNFTSSARFTVRISLVGLRSSKFEHLECFWSPFEFWI